MNGLLNSFSNNILLNNLIKIRWIAITGQLVAILLVYFYFNIQIPILFCLLIVTISTLVNVLSFFSKKNNYYLSDNEAFYFLLFPTVCQRHLCGVIIFYFPASWFDWSIGHRVYFLFALLPQTPLYFSMPILFLGAVEVAGTKGSDDYPLIPTA